MRHYISIETVNKIRLLFTSDPSRYEIEGGITPWTEQKHGVTFNGIDPRYYIEGPAEKITWFLLKL
jgi:hypothetical protein